MPTLEFDTSVLPAGSTILSAKLGYPVEHCVRPLPSQVKEPALWAHANRPMSRTNLPGFTDRTWQQLFVEAAYAWLPYSKRMYLGCHDYHARKFFDWFLPHAPTELQVTGAIQSPMALQGYDLPTVTDTPDIYDLYARCKWQLVAAHAMAIAAWTGTDEVVLDMEGPLTPFHSGVGDIKAQKLSEALKPLAHTGVTILFYLADVLKGTNAFPTRHDETIRLVEAVARAVPDSRFMCTQLTHPHHWLDLERIQCMTELISMVGWERVHLRTICTTRGNAGVIKPCYTPQTVQKVLDVMPYDVSIYPGAANLLETAEAFGAMAEGV